MAQYELNLRDYYRILRRHIFVVIAAGIALGGITWQLGDSRTTYQASSTVRITEQSTVAGLLLQTFTWSAGDNISTQTTLITSQPVLLEIAHMRYGKYVADLEFIIPDSVDIQEAVNKEDYQQVLADLQGIITARQVGSSSLIQITATVNDQQVDAEYGRETARDLAREAAQAYEKYSQQTLNEKYDKARSYITDQIALVRGRLKATQDSLATQRMNRPATSMGDLALSALVTRSTDLTERMLSLQELAQRLAAGGETLVTVGSSLSADAAAPYQQLLSDLSGLMQERRRLLLTYTVRAEPVAALDERIGDLRDRILRLVREDIDLLREQLAIINGSLQAYPADSVRMAELARAVSLNSELLSQLESSLQEVEIQAAQQEDNVEIVDLATGASEDQSGGRSTKSIIGFLLGIMLGIVLAFIVETMDTSIGTIEDVEEYLETSVLAVIPHLGVDKVAAQLVEANPALKDDPHLGMYARLITQYDPKSPAAEAYRTLRTNLQFATAARTEDGSGKKKNTFVFSSASLQEGKSTTIVNLAITMAQAGGKVLMLGCNMRRPTIYKSFGLEKERGMVDILTGNLPWRECVKTVTDMMVGPLSLQSIMSMPGLDNLNIITSGGIPPNPSELLNSSRFQQLIEEVREEYDYVLVDCPPILPVTDAAIVSRQVDWAVLIYQVGKVPRNALRRAKSHLTNVGANILGIAMNDVKAEISGYSPYSQYMTKYYGEETKKNETVLQRIRAFMTREKKETTETKASPGFQEHQAGTEDESWIDVDYFEEENGNNGLSGLPYSAAGSAEGSKGEKSVGKPRPTESMDPAPAPLTRTEEAPEENGRRIWIWGLIIVLFVILLFILTGGFGLLGENTTAGSPATGIDELQQTATSTSPVTPVSTPVWSVRAGSYRSEADAIRYQERLARTMGTADTQVWLRAVEVDGLGRWHRVYAGGFAQRASAERLADRLKEDGLSAQPLVQYVTPPVP